MRNIVLGRLYHVSKALINIYSYYGCFLLRNITILGYSKPSVSTMDVAPADSLFVLAMATAASQKSDDEGSGELDGWMGQQHRPKNVVVGPQKEILLMSWMAIRCRFILSI